MVWHYRAKEVRSGHGKWVYGDYFSRYENGSTYHYILTHPYGRDGGREVIWHIDPATLGRLVYQAAAGNIYEDDIVWTDHNFGAQFGNFVEHIGIVKSGRASWDLVKRPIAVSLEVLIRSKWKLEVRGNTHDNPELVEEHGL